MKNRFTYQELEIMSKLIEVGINDTFTEMMNMRESDGYAADYLYRDMDRLIDLGNKIDALIYRKRKHKYYVVCHFRRINNTTIYGELGTSLKKQFRYHIIPKKIDSDLPF